jgi:ABC-type transport system involved in multi-copper enzyme maturation permease subunit
MIRQIVYKEVLENVLSLRFLLSLLLAILLFAASGFVFLGRYKKQSQEYWRKTNENLSALQEESNQLYKLAFYQQKILCKPKPLTFCAEGFEKSLPNHFKFNIFGIHLPEIEGRSNFMLPHFSDIDWTFIISLILSFVALVFTYDCICGEREQGTLRLMLSGTIPRYEVLLGKYLAAMLTLIIPLLIGLIVSLIIVISSSDVVIGGAAWLKILAIILLSLLYLSVFVLLGVFFSSRVAHSANCMVILLLIWVGLVILVPSLGRIISDVSSECPSRADFERKLHEVVSEIWNNADKYGKNAGSMSHNPNWPKNNPPARARLRTATTNAINQVRDNHHNQLLAQTLTGRSATCFSPVVIYQRASEAITGTGINHCVNLYQQIRQYQAGLKEYIRGEDAHDPNSLHLIFDEEGCARSWKAISHKPVDFATVPKFQERDLALGQSLKLAIWDIGLLALFNLVFFAASYVSFLRYDVR